MNFGIDLFFALFNNLAIFLALVAIYGYLGVHFRRSTHGFERQIILGLSFGVFAIGCMFAKIPVIEGVIVDQRNAIVALSGIFGGPLSAILSAMLAGAFRIYLGGSGALSGVIGVSLAAMAGIGLHRFSGRFKSVRSSAFSALLATAMILPGFLFFVDLPTGWALLKAMALPYGAAIFLGIFLGGLLLHRGEERYEVELLFRESEKKYRELVEGTSDLITQTDGHGTIGFVNHVSEKLLGYHPGDCIGKSAFQFIHPDDRARTIEWFNNCVSQKRSQAQIENRQVNAKTGKSFSVLWSSAFHFDDSGNLIRVGSIARDVTEILEMEASYKNLFEKMPDGYAIHEIVRDPEGKPVDYRFISINPALERMTGLTAKEYIGKTVRETLPDKAQYWFDIYNEIALSGKPATFEHYSDVLNKHFEVTVYSPAKDNLASIFQDITLRKESEEKRSQIEEQLRQAQKMEAIGKLSGGIAHDFNNILMPIIGYVELGMMTLSPDDKLYANLKRVREAAERAEGLTRQILAFSRNQVLEMQVIDLNTVVTDFKKMMRHLIREDIDLKIFTDPTLFRIKADKGQMEQVLMNLIVNARDAMPSGGTLTIETANVYLDEVYVKKYLNLEASGQYVVLAVSDTGHGMDAETRQKIFDPFFTTKEEGKGTGLGLSTVFGIVKQHGGNIWVYSEPGQGTTFKIYLPQAEGEVQIPHSMTTEPVSNFGTETILVVEDDEMVRHLICETLTAHGYDVLDARDPDVALRLAAECRKNINLLLTDVIMPGMNGGKLYQEIVVFHPKIKVLYMSGYTDNAIVNHSILSKGENYLQKPFNVQSLTQKVRYVLK